MDLEILKFLQSALSNYISLDNLYSLCFARLEPKNQNMIMFKTNLKSQINLDNKIKNPDNFMLFPYNSCRFYLKVCWWLLHKTVVCFAILTHSPCNLYFPKLCLFLLFYLCFCSKLQIILFFLKSYKQTSAFGYIFFENQT